MSSIVEGDVVVLIEEIPEAGLAKGTLGAVVACFTEPSVAYETEFVDANGRTRCLLTLTEEQVRRAS